MTAELHPLQLIEGRIAGHVQRYDSLLAGRPGEPECKETYVRMMLMYDRGEFDGQDFEEAFCDNLKAINSEGLQGWIALEEDLKRKKYASRAAEPEPNPYAEEIERLLERKDIDPLDDPWPEITSHQKAFLLNLMHFGTLAKACLGGMQLIHHYRWLRFDKAYQLAYDGVQRYVADQAFEHLT